MNRYPSQTPLTFHLSTKFTLATLINRALFYFLQLIHNHPVHATERINSGRRASRKATGQWRIYETGFLLYYMHTLHCILARSTTLIFSPFFFPLFLPLADVWFPNNSFILCHLSNFAIQYNNHSLLFYTSVSLNYCKTKSMFLLKNFNFRHIFISISVLEMYENLIHLRWIYIYI